MDIAKQITEDDLFQWMVGLIVTLAAIIIGIVLWAFIQSPIGMGIALATMIALVVIPYLLGGPVKGALGW